MDEKKSTLKTSEMLDKLYDMTRRVRLQWTRSEKWYGCTAVAFYCDIENYIFEINRDCIPKSENSKNQTFLYDISCQSKLNRDNRLSMYERVIETSSEPSSRLVRLFEYVASMYDGSCRFQERMADIIIKELERTDKVTTNTDDQMQ